MIVNGDFYEHYELKLKRGTFAPFVFIHCPVIKAAGEAIGGSSNLATVIVASALVGG